MRNPEELTQDLLRRYSSSHFFSGRTFVDPAFKSLVYQLVQATRLHRGCVPEIAWSTASALSRCEPLHEQCIDSPEGALLIIAVLVYSKKDIQAAKDAAIQEYCTGIRDKGEAISMKANIWIRDPYPFRQDERYAIEEALRMTYGDWTLTYLHQWPEDVVSVNSCTMTTCKQIAATLKTIHRQWAIQDKKDTGRVYCKDLEVEIRGILDGRPEWQVPVEGK